MDFREIVTIEPGMIQAEILYDFPELTEQDLLARFAYSAASRNPS